MHRNIFKILCVHQGGELYGSDRSFLQSVQAIRECWPDADLRVTLASDGPLRYLLESVCDAVIIRNLSVLRLATPIQTIIKATIAAPYFWMRAGFDIRQADLVYINTTVIYDYMIASRIDPKKVVIHAREIPKGKAMCLIRTLMRFSGAHIIFNSAATEKAFALKSSQRSVVIHNAVDAPNDSIYYDIPNEFSIYRPLRVAMLGRISDWKGQDLLIDAIEKMGIVKSSLLKLRIVGSTYKDAVEPLNFLHNKINSARLNDVISIEPFCEDTSHIYRWADVCVVPSKLPEPFGRVAIEAMSFGRPVIAAAHGGLTEIIVDGDSGWLFTPCSSSSLAGSLSQALESPLELKRRAMLAHDRYRAHFSSKTMSKKLKSTLRAWLVD